MVAKLFILLGLVALAYCENARQSKQDIQSVEDYIDSKRDEINPRYRLLYHVAAPVGWINDPNGFSYYKSEYHLFYQFYPYAAAWGPMHWGHVVSSDLVRWRYLPTALVPEEEMCFSGSAVEDGDTMVLMYTGRINYDDGRYNETQYLAFSDDGITFHKYEGNPVLPSAPNAAQDFRDPKTWRHEDHWYTVIGSRTDDFRGNVLLYRSPDLKNWEFLNVVGESNGDNGYMWECPDFFELDGKHILLISPQGMEPQGDRYRNVHQNGYIIGSFNYETFEFVPEVDFQEIDYGHDFYAAQTTEAHGKRFLVAWFNMWDQHQPEAEDGWAGALTIVRELRLIGDRITMKPVDAMITLRDEEKIDGVLQPYQELRFNQTAELIVSGDLDKKIELQLEGIQGGERAWIRWEPDVGKVVLDRGHDDIRQVEWSPISTRSWRIFLDTCSIELFCGEGEVVFSSRLFPEGGWLITNTGPQDINVQAFSLNTNSTDSPDP